MSLESGLELACSAIFQSVDELRSAERQQQSATYLGGEELQTFQHVAGVRRDFGLR